MVLTCVDYNSQPILGPVTGVSGESGVYYDALQLSNDPQGKTSATLDVGATPTIFYRHGENGLREIVVLKASGLQPLRRGSATLTLAGKPYSCNLDSEYDFGDTACAVQVSEFEGSAPA